MLIFAFLDLAELYSGEENSGPQIKCLGGQRLNEDGAG